MNVQIDLHTKENNHSLLNFLIFNNGERNRVLAENYLDMQEKATHKFPQFVVAHVNNELIGAAAFSEEIFTVGTWGISWVSVHEKYRNKGIGEKIVKFCLSKIKEQYNKSHTVILGTYPHKTGLYEKCGFQKGYQTRDGGWFMFKEVK